jgi:hypothetical protein
MGIGFLGIVGITAIFAARFPGIPRKRAGHHRCRRPIRVILRK